MADTAATAKLYHASMAELIKLLNIFKMGGGKTHYILWNAFIGHSIVNVCKCSNVDAASTTASGQAYALLPELIYDIKAECDRFRDLEG